ncbi:hypothetical protein [Streptomyces globisporus]|uniref:hypothetical protein n=1 Tax=Streptomyces globisporus TaxID=1908 RepID=UPI000690A0E5|nr:hypothetical protein [Streptomyces globisporus]
MRRPTDSAFAPTRATVPSPRGLRICVLSGSTGADRWSWVQGGLVRGAQAHQQGVVVTPTALPQALARSGGDQQGGGRVGGGEPAGPLFGEDRRYVQDTASRQTRG